MKRKKQPSAEVYREQLRLAADMIIELREQVLDTADLCAIVDKRMPGPNPWYVRLFRNPK